MERDVSRPVEEALNTVQGIKEINSTSQEGQSQVRVSLNLDVNVLEAQQEVVAKIARIRRSLPPDIQDPVVCGSTPTTARSWRSRCGRPSARSVT